MRTKPPIFWAGNTLTHTEHDSQRDVWSCGSVRVSIYTSGVIVATVKGQMASRKVPPGREPSGAVAALNEAAERLWTVSRANLAWLEELGLAADFEVLGP